MGSPPGLGYLDEHPQHSVSIAPFLIGRSPITQAHWQAVMRQLPPCRFRGPDRPVENVTWRAAAAFCLKLSRQAGRPFALPSEAQWEYACRAGTISPFAYGPTITTDLVNYAGQHTYADGPAGIYRHETTAPGQFPPNAFGLYDMHGNVWEWCADPWHDSYLGAPTDGRAWETGGDLTHRIMRGGSWHDVPDSCRSAVRSKFPETEGDDYIGFRVVAASV